MELRALTNIGGQAGPLAAGQVTFKFYDVASKQVRDISGIYSLAPK